MRVLVAVVLLVFGAACSRAPEAPPASSTDTTPPAAAPTAPARATTGWTVSEGIATPESVYVDEGSGFVFVSQIDGMPTDHDGNGRIVKLGADGTVVAADW